MCPPPSPTDVLLNTTTANVSLYCQVLNVGPKFINSGQKLWKEALEAKAHQA